MANEGLEASFESLPVPDLEENDPVSLEVSGYVFAFPLHSFTIPLTHDSTMSVGGLLQVRPKAAWWTLASQR